MAESIRLELEVHDCGAGKMDLMDEFLRMRGAMFASVSNDS